MHSSRITMCNDTWIILIVIVTWVIHNRIYFLPNSRLFVVEKPTCQLLCTRILFLFLFWSNRKMWRKPHERNMQLKSFDDCIVGFSSSSASLLSLMHHNFFLSWFWIFSGRLVDELGWFCLYVFDLTTTFRLEYTIYGAQRQK